MSSAALTMDQLDAGRPAVNPLIIALAVTLAPQANMLAYVDCFWILGAAVLGMIPLVFLMKKLQTGGEMAVH